ncbi:MAG: hypothetical protein NVSMB6_14180 [Burkholderiaceae bacterium]
MRKNILVATGFLAVSSLLTSPAFAQGSEFPLPYSTKGWSELNSIVEQRKQSDAYESQEIRIDDQRKLIAVYKTVNSGILSVIGAVYGCDIYRCELLLFRRCRCESVKMEFNDKDSELLLRDQNGKELVRAQMQDLIKLRPQGKKPS